MRQHPPSLSNILQPDILLIGTRSRQRQKVEQKPVNQKGWRTDDTGIGLTHARSLWKGRWVSFSFLSLSLSLQLHLPFGLSQSGTLKSQSHQHQLHALQEKKRKRTRTGLQVRVCVNVSPYSIQFVMRHRVILSLRPDEEIINHPHRSQPHPSQC